MKRARRPYAVYAMTADLLARIRRAEWVKGRQREIVKKTRETYRPQKCDDWRGIVQRMR